MQHSARALMMAAAAAAMFASALIWTGSPPTARGDTPTPTAPPTPSASPTPSPTPTPYPQSTITIRFVRDGEPVEVTFSVFAEISANGILCPLLQPGVVGVASEYSILWPLVDPSLPDDCTEGPPTVLQFEFLALTPSLDESLPLAVQLTWNGSSTSQDIEVPARFAALQSPPASATPADLPTTGGFPRQADGLPGLEPTALTGALMALAGFIAARCMARRCAT